MPFIYPTSAEMRTIEPDLLQRAAAGRVGIELMPVRNVNAAKVRWTQADNYYGLQQLRGLDGAPVHVVRVGQKMYEYEPGVFGEFVDITETELVTRAGSIMDVAGTPVDVQDLVVEAENILIGRELDRIESSNWAVMTTGTISIKLDGPNGTQTGYSDTFTLQTFTAGVPWATIATATPIRNLQAVQQLGLGHSVDLGAGAVAYMNSVTSNNMLNNTNASDLAGRRVNGGNTPNTLADVNRYFAGQGLLQIQVYDGGFIPTSGGSFTKFIPDATVVVVGRRTSGARLGEYVMTRNASNGFKPGSYRTVIDRANGINAEKRIPANIEIHRGHNGGPVIYYPSAIVRMNV